MNSTDITFRNACASVDLVTIKNLLDDPNITLDMKTEPLPFLTIYHKLMRIKNIEKSVYDLWCEIIVAFLKRSDMFFDENMLIMMNLNILMDNSNRVYDLFRILVNHPNLNLNMLYDPEGTDDNPAFNTIMGYRIMYCDVKKVKMILEVPGYDTMNPMACHSAGNPMDAVIYSIQSYCDRDKLLQIAACIANHLSFKMSEKYLTLENHVNYKHRHVSNPYFRFLRFDEETINLWEKLVMREGWRDRIRNII